MSNPPIPIARVISWFISYSKLSLKFTMLCIVRNFVQMEVHYVGDYNMVLLVNVDLRAIYVYSVHYDWRNIENTH